MASREFKVGDRVRAKSKEAYDEANRTCGSMFNDGWDAVVVVCYARGNNVSVCKGNSWFAEYLVHAQVSMAERVAKLLQKETNGNT